jgi:cysteine-rich repeat protein
MMQHECYAEKLLEVQEPRAMELMRFAGVNATALLPCLVDHGGNGENLNDPKGAGKAVESCEKTIKKTGIKFVSKKLKSLQKCADAVFTCVQTKPGETKCMDKANATCTKELDKIAQEEAKIGPAIDKKCADSEIAYAVLGASNAANLDALAMECALYGVGSLSTLADYKQCVFQQHECRVEELVRFEVPRAEELFGALTPPVDLRSAFCPAPAICGDGLPDPGEQCDDGNNLDGDCCSATCEIETIGTVCRASAGDCDVEETCDGVSPTCPAEVVLTAGTECRASGWRARHLAGHYRRQPGKEWESRLGYGI